MTTKHCPLGGVVRSHRATRHPFWITFEGIEYLVGPNVSHFTQPIDQMDFERFQESPDLLVFYAALYQMVSEGGRQEALAITGGDVAKE